MILIITKGNISLIIIITTIGINKLLFRYILKLLKYKKLIILNIINNKLTTKKNIKCHLYIYYASMFFKQNNLLILILYFKNK